LVFCIAHRGASFWEPENSLAAIEAAVKLEASHVEIDVRRCRDCLLSFHDATLDRTTDGRGPVSQLSLQEVKELYLGVGQRIPTLKEALESMKGRIDPLVEVKEPGTEAEALKAAEEAGLLDSTLFVSFHHQALLNLKRLNPEAQTGIIFRGEILAVVEAARKVEANWILPDYRHTTPEMVSKAKAEGLKVGVWVVNDKAEAERLKGLGVDAISSDRPEILTGKPLHRPLRAYIAGPIQGLEEKQEYREVLAGLLEECGFKPLDPWLREQAYYRSLTADVNEAYKLVRRDLLDLQYCELLVAYMPRLSAGVAMEIYHAKLKNKKVYLISPVKTLSPWLQAHTDKIFKTIREFEKFLKAQRNEKSSTFDEI
jgi:glycerophosphoryl diester phosphodiesterase